MQSTEEGFDSFPTYRPSNLADSVTIISLSLTPTEYEIQVC